MQITEPSLNPFFDAATKYTGLNWIVHPLTTPDKDEPSAGKRPTEAGWQKRGVTRTEAEIKKYFGPERKQPFNIGLQCGERSGVLVIDVDDWNPAIWEDLTAGLNAEAWLMSHRTTGRGHIYFKFTDSLKACKHHDLGIEILSNGNNAVLPPSVHPSGDVYSFNREPEGPEDLPEMPDELADRLKVLFETNDKLKAVLGKSKPCLRDKFKAHQKNPDVNDFHSAEGRQLTLALMADIGANGAGPEVMDLASRYLFREQYEPGRTADEIGKIGKPWKCSTIQRELNSITLDEGLKSKCDTCPFRGSPKPTTNKKEPTANKKPIAGKKTSRTGKTPAPEKKEDPLNVDIDEENQPEEVIKEAEEEAKRILSEGDPINYILDTIEKKHTGDRHTMEGIAVSIAGQSCRNTAGLQISVNGESGSGKSHGLKSHLHLVPRKYKRETSLSAKAAYYMGLEPGLILFSDDTDPDEAAEEVIKRATTNYQEYTVHTTVKDQKTQTMTVPPRINWYLTSVESNVSDQLLNRQLTFSTDSGAGQKKSIFEMQKEEALAGEIFMLEVTPEVLTCRRIYGKIKTGLFKVKIPFAERIEIRDKSNSRIFPMFLDMIKGYSVFKYQQRDRDEDGYILADIEDFTRAKALFESQQESIVSKLTDRERKIIMFIGQKTEGCNLNEIANGTGYSYTIVSRALKGRKDREGSGLMGKLEGLTMTDQTTTDMHIVERDGREEWTDHGPDGKRKGRRETIFFIDPKKADPFNLFDKSFISLREE